MNNEQKNKFKNRVLRRNRTRKTIIGKEHLPRLNAFRSLKHFYLQVIDDTIGKTICAASDFEIKNKKELKPVEVAREVGKLVAKKALAKKVEKVVYDRGLYKYHGQVKAGAEGAREGGLKF